MPHFLIKSSDIIDNKLELHNESILKHLFVMRKSAGETVKFIDESRLVSLVKIEKIAKKELIGTVINSYYSTRFLSKKIKLIQCVLRDAQMSAVSNAVQIGVSEIQPVLSDFTSVKKSALSLEKMEKAAYEAFKQCERADLAVILPVQTLSEAISNSKNIIVLGERNCNSTIKEFVQKYKNEEEITVVIGPEGGFSDNEFEFFDKLKLPIVSIGNTILKAENAIISGIGIISYEFDR